VEILHINKPSIQQTQNQNMENIKAGAQAIGEKAQAKASEAKHEANKTAAKDSDLPAGTRLQAAKDAVGDKVDQTKHEVNKEYQKQKATH